MVAPGNPANALVNSAAVSVRSFEAGAHWNGSDLVPLLELADVSFTFAGTPTHYARIDLTHADSAVDAAKDLVLTAIRAALGTTGAAHNLAVLAGIDKPASDPAWPHLVNVGQLVSNPANAIAAVHRAALLDSTHSWALLFAEIASLLGISTPMSGAGVFEDPWRVTLESDTISVELAAWNAQPSNAADSQQLRVGLRLSAESAPWSMAWLAELLAFDLPASGAPRIALMGGLHARFLVQPIPSAPETAGVSIGADSLAMILDWSPGGPLQIRAVVSNLSVTSGATVSAGSIQFIEPAAGARHRCECSANSLARSPRAGIVFMGRGAGFDIQQLVWAERQIARPAARLAAAGRRLHCGSSRSASCLARQSGDGSVRGWFSVFAQRARLAPGIF
jgi:hypothetical protein